jgi:hypothetical protein
LKRHTPATHSGSEFVRRHELKHVAAVRDVRQALGRVRVAHGTLPPVPPVRRAAAAVPPSPDAAAGAAERRQIDRDVVRRASVLDASTAPPSAG